MLALPLIVFLLSTFIAPIALLLARSVQNREVPDSMPAFARALDSWDGRGVPDERRKNGGQIQRRRHRAADLAERLELTHPALELLEQARIFDGDDGLIRKRFNQGDLALAGGQLSAGGVPPPT